MPDKPQHEPIRIPFKLLLLAGTPGAPAIDALQAIHARFGGVPTPTDPGYMVDVFAAATAVRTLYKDPAAAEVELALDLAEQVYNSALEPVRRGHAVEKKPATSKSFTAAESKETSSDSTTRVEAGSVKMDNGGKRGETSAEASVKPTPCNCNHYERAFQMESLLGRVQALEEDLVVLKIKAEYDAKERLLE